MGLGLYGFSGYKGNFWVIGDENSGNSCGRGVVAEPREVKVNSVSVTC